MPHETLPSRVRSLRKRAGLTQSDFAKLLGVTNVTVSRWENGAVTPSSAVLKEIQKLEAHGLEPWALSFTNGAQPSLLPPSEREEPSAPGSHPVDFAASPLAVRAVVEGERLSRGYLANPAFAAEMSRIDPLPHQHVAVYERMLHQQRLRFLLADDPGAGKTIMTGLYLRETMARDRIGRVLIVTPAGLLGNWQAELRRLFDLQATLVRGRDFNGPANPFRGEQGNLVLISIDTLATERVFKRLGEANVDPYDLVVFDEAHRLSVRTRADGTDDASRRFKLASALAGAGADEERWNLPWAARHLLLLTATPHMGHDDPYFALWRLLDPEAFASPDAVHRLSEDARKQFFLRRTKEQMVSYDNEPIFPPRVTSSLGFTLDADELALYEDVTRYIQTIYQRALAVNPSAARLVLSVFQRRLASSTAALQISLERRLQRLDELEQDVRSGRISPAELQQRSRAQTLYDPYENTLAGEAPDDENTELNEDDAVQALLATTLNDLDEERTTLRGLIAQAQHVLDRDGEAKLARLLQYVHDPDHQNERLLIFTEHRDTLLHIKRRLAAAGYANDVVSIDGTMDYPQREAALSSFLREADDNGARILVATDAAGEGLNMQKCSRMVNYDLPWNPARLEQRMGRIHRYGQKADKVYITNLVATNTREGHVMQTLLEKLDRIRAELSSDKVFDVLGRLFQDAGHSLSSLLRDALDTDAETARKAQHDIDRALSPERVQELDRATPRDAELRPHMRELKAQRERAHLRRLLPGYVRRYLENAAPTIGLKLTDAFDEASQTFALDPTTSVPLHPLRHALNRYDEPLRHRLTTLRPPPGAPDDVIWVRPGEPVFEAFRGAVHHTNAAGATRGAVFQDPSATRPYTLHVARVAVERAADPETPGLEHTEILERTLLVLKRSETGAFELLPSEAFLLLPEAEDLPIAYRHYAQNGQALALEADAFAEQWTDTRSRRLAEDLRNDLPERLRRVNVGFDLKAATLATRRAALRTQNADPDASKRIREQQQHLARDREEAIARLLQAPELLHACRPEWLAHALVIPAQRPEERHAFDANVERQAVETVMAKERARGAQVFDVSTPARARAMGLTDWPGFDLLSRHPNGEERCIEVKGLATQGDVDLTENEVASAATLLDRYWLYVVRDCATPTPQPIAVQNPWAALRERFSFRVRISHADLSRVCQPL